MDSSSRRSFIRLAAASLLVVACSPAMRLSGSDAGPPLDAGPVDSGVSPDSGVVDAGPPDAGLLDAGPPDAGLLDSDAGLLDSGPDDAGLIDAGIPDAGRSLSCPSTYFDFAPCSSNSDCCSYLCGGDGHCQPVCSWKGAGCDSYLPCCDGLICGAAAECTLMVGQPCSDQYDCISGYCSQGVCAVPPDAGSSTDPCSWDNGGCPQNAVCSSDGRAIHCTCAPGFEGSGTACFPSDSPKAGTPDSGPDNCNTSTPTVQLDQDAGMVIVPAGPFWRGCNSAADTQCQGDEFPGRCLTLSAYEIDRTEVTQGAYEACVTDGGCSPPSLSECSPSGSFNYDPTNTPDLPVACVSWDQASAFCTWAGGHTKRLPTEAEWEKAARGTDGRIYPWGNQNPDSEANPCSYADYDPCPMTFQPVGTLPLGSSSFGAMDMSGNVWEWVSDWYDPDYYASAPDVDPPGPPSNPMGLEDYGMFHVYRGGGITDPTIFQRSSNRFGGPPGIYFNVGVRCARSLPSGSP